MADLLVDTDVMVDHLRGRRRLERGSDRLYYSVVTRAELFAGRGGEDRRIRRLLDSMAEIPIDRPIAERAGRLRRAGGIRLPDALIAATALEHRLALATRNVRDFADVKGLRLRAPAT